MSDAAEIAPGDPVEVRTASGEWVTATARSGVRVDRNNAIRRSYWPSVAVDHPGFDHPVNWPAEHVRRASPDASTEEREQ